MSPVSFGIEEEFMMLRAMELSPDPIAADVRRDLIADPAMSDYVNQEFLASQLEYSSPVFTEASTALCALRKFRERLGQAANHHNVLAVGSGLPFTTDRQPIITNDIRYQKISSGIRGIVREHQMNAMHVHIGIDSRDDGVKALNAMRIWIPTLLALSVNSPFWQGKDTGFSSWRSIQLRRWPTSGCPPHFHDAEDYAHRTAQIIKVGAAIDKGAIAWGARLSESFPTVEIRVFDSQLDAESTMLLALLARALVVATASSSPTEGPNTELLDAALWCAARDGLSTVLINPVSGEIAPAGEVVSALMRHVRPTLLAHGDWEFVEDALARRLHDGTGAERQRNAFRSQGVCGLRTLFRATL